MYKNNTFADKLAAKIKPLLKKWWFWAIVVPPALVLMYFANIWNEQLRLEQDTEKQEQAQIIHEQDSIKIAELKAKRDKLISDFKQLEISHWSYRLGGSGKNIALLNIDFSNQSSDIEFKDIIVQVTFQAESGTILNKVQRTINSIVVPHDTKCIEEFSFGFVNSQTKTASIEIISADME